MSQTRSGVIRNGPFLRLWLAQALSQTAQQVINFTLVVLVRQIVERGSLAIANTAVAILILCFATPPILFSALAGVVVERAKKRLIMAVVNAARAACIAGYLLLGDDWPLPAMLLYIYLLCFFFSTVGQLFGPAEGSTIPLLVSREQLIRANALFNLTFISSQLLGFVVLGPLLTVAVGFTRVYFIVIGLYLVCVLLILSLPALPIARRGDGPTTVRQDLREVWHYVTGDRLLRKAIIALTVTNSSFLMLAALAPEFVVNKLRLTTNGLAMVVVPAGLGMLSGVIVVGRFGRRRRHEVFVDRALIGSGLALCLFALGPDLLVRIIPVGAAGFPAPPVLIAMICAGFAGMANAFILVPSQTLLQERSTERIRARVLATFFTVSNAAALIPILFAGILGDLIGVVGVIIVIAFLLLTLGVVGEVRRR